MISFSLFFKTAMLWFIIAVFAIGNGILRESVFVPYFGETVALPLSGITLSIIIFALTYLMFGLIGKKEDYVYLTIGIQWVAMTLIFEFVFGHYILKKSWIELFQVFNVLEGNLFLVALITSLVSPLLVSRIKKET